MDTLVKYGTLSSGSLPRTGTGLLALLLFGFGARLAGQQAPCLNRTLAVAVTTQDYQPVKDLTAANFSARVGREPVKIKSASLATGARIVFVIDASGSMTSGDWKWKSGNAATEGLYQSAPPETSLALLTFAGKVENRVDFSQGTNAVAGKLRQLEGKDWNRSPQAMRGTALTDAILGALDLLGPRRLGDAIYLVSDGMENSGKVTRLRGGSRVLSSGVRVFAFVPVSNKGWQVLAPDELDGPEMLGQLSKDSGGDIVVCAPAGAFDIPHAWPLHKSVHQGASACLTAARMMNQEITEFYRLDLELPERLDKPTKWQLEATKLMGGKNVHLRVMYPHKLQPCQ